MTVHTRTHWLLMLFVVTSILGLCIYLFGMSRLSLLLWATASAVIAWRRSVTEVIEFDSQKITIRENILRWKRTPQYLVERCSELKWEFDGEVCGLQFDAGWRRIQFGEGLTEDKASEILAALQKHLPDVAWKMRAKSRWL